jgi:hypothetical protein
MTSNHRSAHERSGIAAYAEVQRRQALNTANASSNFVQRIVNSDASESELSIIFTIFISSPSSDRAFFDDKTLDDITTTRKTIEKKYAVKKKSRINKRSVIHKVS